MKEDQIIPATSRLIRRMITVAVHALRLAFLFDKVEVQQDCHPYGPQNPSKQHMDELSLE